MKSPKKTKATVGFEHPPSRNKEKGKPAHINRCVKKLHKGFKHYNLYQLMHVRPPVLLRAARHRTGGRIQYMVVRSYGVRCRSYLRLIYSKGRMLRVVLHAMRAGISAGGREGGSDAAHA